MDQMGGIKDNQQINKAIREVVGAFEENVIIKKWLSRNTELPAEGVAPADVYTSVKSTAVVDDIGIAALSMQDSVYAAGDLQFQLRVAMAAPSSNPYHPGDRIVYEGIEYRLVQKPMTEFISGLLFYTCIARRVTD